LYLPHLRKSFLGDRQRFYQNGNVTHLPWNRIHVLFIVHDELSHKTMPFFNAALLKISGETKILVVRTARDAGVVGAGAPNHWNNEITDFHPRDLRSYSNDFAQGFMTDHQMFRAGGRSPVFESADLPICPADARLDHTQLHVRGGRNLWFGLIDNRDFLDSRSNGNSFHKELSSSSSFGNGQSTPVKLNLAMGRARQ
jgi:hypothetical protein